MFDLKEKSVILATSSYDKIMKILKREKAISKI